VLDGAYTMTYRGQSSNYKTDKNNVLLFDVVSRDRREKLLARLPFAQRPLEDGTLKIFGHPAIVHHLAGDLYLSLRDGPDDLYPRGRYVKSIPLGGTLSFKGYTFRFDSFERDPQAAAMAMTGQMPATMPVWALLYVSYHGTTSLLKPEFVIRRDQPGDPDTPETALPGGWNIAFTAMNAGRADKNAASAESGTFVIRPDGPVVEGFELEVTTRPMIWLVWLGTALIALGGLVSMVRRIRDPGPPSPRPSPGGRRSKRGPHPDPSHGGRECEVKWPVGTPVPK
jgi:hypothetical protein